MPKKNWWLPTRPLTKAEEHASGSFAEDRAATDKRVPPRKPKTGTR